MTEENQAGQASLIDVSGATPTVDQAQPVEAVSSNADTPAGTLDGETVAALSGADAGSTAAQQSEQAGNEVPSQASPIKDAPSDDVKSEGDPNANASEDEAKSEGDPNGDGLNAPAPIDGPNEFIDPGAFTVSVGDIRDGSVVHAVKIVGGAEFIQFAPEGDWIEI